MVRPISKLLLLLKPDKDCAGVLHGLARRHCLRHGQGRAVRADLLHVTLLVLEESHDVPWSKILAARPRLDRIAVPPMAMRFNRCVASRGEDPHLILKGDNSDAADLARWMRGYLGWGQASAPHMTLVHGSGTLPPLPIEAPVSWTAREMVLVFSHWGQGRHQCFGRWTLHGRRAEQLRFDFGSAPPPPLPQLPAGPSRIARARPPP